MSAGFAQNVTVKSTLRREGREQAHHATQTIKPENKTVSLRREGKGTGTPRDADALLPMLV